MTRVDPDRRVLQIALGVGFLVLLTLVVCGALIGWGYLPGVLGEWVGTMIGAMTSPFLLEASFFVIGICLVVVFNHWRRKREGDELVYLEQVADAEAAEKLPDHAKWAVYRENPLPGEVPSLLAQAEGAMAVRDFDAASACLAAMDAGALREPEVLALRLELARATGREELAREIAGEIEKQGNG